MEVVIIKYRGPAVGFRDEGTQLFANVLQVLAHLQEADNVTAVGPNPSIVDAEGPRGSQ